jgi:hypothetical protein
MMSLRKDVGMSSGDSCLRKQPRPGRSASDAARDGESATALADSISAARMPQNVIIPKVWLKHALERASQPPL